MCLKHFDGEMSMCTFVSSKDFQVQNVLFSTLKPFKKTCSLFEICPKSYVSYTDPIYKALLQEKLFKSVWFKPDRHPSWIWRSATLSLHFCFGGLKEIKHLPFHLSMIKGFSVINVVQRHPGFEVAEWERKLIAWLFIQTVAISPRTENCIHHSLPPSLPPSLSLSGGL